MEKKPTAEDYIEERLKPQIEWYDNKASRAKRMFYFWGGIQILMSALVPLFNSLLRFDIQFVYIASICGAIAVIGGGIIVFSRLRENWMTYRRTHTDLTSNLVRYQQQVKPYTGENSREKLVEICEKLMLDENSKWEQQ